MRSKYIYKWKEYTWDELLDLHIKIDYDFEKKWWKRYVIDKVSYSKGFLSGMLYGTQVMGSIRDGNEEFEFKFDSSDVKNE